MIFGSVCSGIEAASVAWDPLGWRAAWFAEVDPAPSKVLAHRWPHVVNHGDMRTLAAKIRAREIAAPDVLVGGTPCQSFSIAGLRGGLSDARGALTLEYVRILDAIDDTRDTPAVAVWENVPGALSSDDNAFGCFLAALAGCPEPLIPGLPPASGKSSRYWKWIRRINDHVPKWPRCGAVTGPRRTVCWRVLDAQYFGVAQRRRRLFVVASAPGGPDPAQILFEWEGVRRDTAPQRENGEAAPCHTGEGAAARGSWWDGGQVSQTLDAVLAKGQCMPEKNRFPAVLQPSDQFCFKASHFTRGKDGAPSQIAPPLSADADKGDQDTLVLAFPSELSGTACAFTTGVSPSLGAMSRTAVCIQNATRGLHQNGLGVSGFGDPMYTLDTGSQHAVGVQASQSGTRVQDVAGTLDSNYGSRRHNGVLDTVEMTVRRLLPVECERLQGFPDGHTVVPGVSETARYTALGNSMAVPVMRWIGRRIEQWN